MTACVVDTNVLVAANGWGTHADQKCHERCVEELERIKKHCVVVVDCDGRIIEEYMKQSFRTPRRAGQALNRPPGAGDKFFKHVFDNGYKPARVRRVRITPTDDDGRGFEELPVNRLDRADRKFLATAVVGNAPILNATDSDWDEQKELTTKVGVEVRQLCPQHASKAR